MLEYYTNIFDLIGKLDRLKNQNFLVYSFIDEQTYLVMFVL